ncbi:MAG: hypothetical protein AB8G05_13890 [Oligoflexales bacterium]
MLFNLIKYMFLFLLLSLSFIVYVGACGKEIFEDSQNEVAESLEEETSQPKTKTTF